MIKGDFHVVEYLGWETTYTEIVTGERLRHKSQEPPIDARTFLKFSINLPEDVRHFYQRLSSVSSGESEEMDLNRDFKMAINAAKVEFIKDQGVLRVLTRDESSQRRAGMLQVQT